MRVLVIYYSQTGDSAEVARTIGEPFCTAGHVVTMERIQAVPEYPFPWRNPLRFFGVLPECLLGPSPAIHPLSFTPQQSFDLIILVYQVWFLAPSLPIQGFLDSEFAAVLNGANVVTVSVSRKMWLSASEQMKSLLSARGACLLDNIVVTHQGAPWATFVTAPRSLLFGHRDACYGIFPPAGLGESELTRVQRLGTLLCTRWSERPSDNTAPLLQGAGAVVVDRRYLIPECLGWYLFKAWAHLLKGLGKPGSVARGCGIVGFIGFLVAAIVVGIPIVWVLTGLLWPILLGPVETHAKKIAAPSGEAVVEMKT